MVKQKTKYMKTFIKPAMLAIAASVISCQEFYIDTQPEENFRVFKTDAVSPYTRPSENAKTINFNISSTVPWKITKSGTGNTDWCTIEPMESTTLTLSSAVTVTLSDNDGTAERSVTLTITAEGIETPHTIEIIQEKEHFLTVTAPTETTIPAGGGTYSFTVVSDQAWTVASNRPDVTFSPESGTGTGAEETVQITVPAGQSRDITVTVSSESKNDSFTMHQEGVILEIEGTGSTTVDAAGGTCEFTVRANIAWDFKTEDKFVKVSRKDETTVSAVFGANPIFKERSVVIEILPTDPSITASAEYTVTQPVAYTWQKGSSQHPVDADGAVTFNDATSGENRFVTGNICGPGTYIWTFASVDLKGKGHFDFNFNQYSLGNINYHFYIGEGGGNKVISGGKVSSVTDPSQTEVDFWASGQTFTISYATLNAMKELKITMEPKEGDPTMLTISIYVDGNRIHTESGRKNFWYHRPSDLLPLYFGLGSNSDAATAQSTVKLASFQIIPYSE